MADETHFSRVIAEQPFLKERAAILLSAIVDNSDDAIVSKSLDGVITSWNRGAQALFGYTPEEAIGQNIFLIIPPDRIEEEKDILKRLRRGELISHFDTVRLRKDGSTVDVSLTISPVRDASGKVIGASKIGRDITERKRTEVALRESEEQYKSLVLALESQVQLRTQELRLQNEEILRQAEQLRDLSRRLLEIQDQERRHIARELHDSAGQTLVAISLNVSQLLRKYDKRDPEIDKTMAETLQLVDQLSQEIRTTSYLLHPPLLDEAGLPSALRWYVDGLRSRSNLDIALSIAEPFERPPSETELVIFRVVQECLTNVHRHSGSRTAEIRVGREDGCLHVEVVDQGKGMSEDVLASLQRHSAGVGIRGIRERVQHLGGELAIQSGASGTTVRATFPATSVSKAAH